RDKTDSFLDLCYNPKLASEVTMQPLGRFDLDAAIIFADILLIPDALGVKVNFVKGEGPLLDHQYLDSNLSKLAFKEDKIKNIYETISIVKQSLPKHVALIGFAGSPWTVAAYMIEGKSSNNFINAKKWLNNEKNLSFLFDILIDSTVTYLKNQIEAGVEVIQLFDSWAGLLDNSNFEKWSIEPTRKIVEELKSMYPDLPIIGFPRNISIYNALQYSRETGVDCISLDYNVNVFDMKNIQKFIPVQGNLHPEILIEGGLNLRNSCIEILKTLAKGPHIFNLGHGILPQTPVQNVIELIDIIKNFKK
ncbi:MAG: hypothetical protein CFH01_01519, partial [Alphaproteobacteria bacterium MarineAlpha2_Bin1]